MYRVLPSAYPTIPGQSEGGYNDPNQPQEPGLDYYNVDNLSYEPQIPSGYVLTGRPKASLWAAQTPPRIELTWQATAKSSASASTSTTYPAKVNVTPQNVSLVTAVRTTLEFTKILDADGNDYAYAYPDPFVQVYSSTDPGEWSVPYSFRGYGIPSGGNKTVNIQEIDYNLKFEVYNAQGDLIQSASVSRTCIYEVS